MVCVPHVLGLWAFGQHTGFGSDLRLLSHVSFPSLFLFSFQLSCLYIKGWYKQSNGDTLTLMVTVRKAIKPIFSPEFSESRFEVKYDHDSNNLTILRTSEEDEGMYHCAVTEWISKTEWSGTYLVVKGNHVIYFYTVYLTKPHQVNQCTQMQMSFDGGDSPLRGKTYVDVLFVAG
uniref:Immunoglobulin domain-containing protein n=1 Tax=Labrus bergylta TaxID=56723 RepID=A0A3Q3NFF6_9LABR